MYQHINVPINIQYHTVSHSISHLSVIIACSETESRPRGQGSEERKHNMLSTLISISCSHVMLIMISMKYSTLFHSSKLLTPRLIIYYWYFMTRLGSTPDINYSIKHFVTSLYFLNVNDSLNLLKMAFLFAKVITSILSFIATQFFS